MDSTPSLQQQPAQESQEVPQVKPVKTRKAPAKKKPLPELKTGTIKKMIKTHSNRVSEQAVEIMRKYAELFISDATKMMASLLGVVSKHKTIRKEEAINALVTNSVKNFKLSEKDIIDIDQFGVKTYLPNATVKNLIKSVSGKSVSLEATNIVRFACTKYINLVISEADKIREISKLKTLEPQHIEHVCTRLEHQ
jgi:histone H3/H4